MNSLPSLSKILAGATPDCSATHASTLDYVEYPDACPAFAQRALCMADFPSMSKIFQDPPLERSKPSAPAQDKGGYGADARYALGGRVPCMSNLPSLSKIFANGSESHGSADSLAMQHK